MINPIQSNSGIVKIFANPSPVEKMSRRHRWHVSSAGFVFSAALAFVVSLSLVGILIGMRYATQSPSSQPSKSDIEAMLMPVQSRSNEEQLDDKPNISSRFNDRKITDDMSIEADALPKNSPFNDEQLTGDKSSEGDDIFSPGSIPTGERQIFNEKKDAADEVLSHSLRHRQTHFPRIISIEGDSDIGANYLRGESDGRKRKIFITKSQLNEQKRLLDSDDFNYRDPLYEGDCVPMQKWQETSFPNCNLLHELDSLGKSRTDGMEHYAKGGYNDIFWLVETDKQEDPELVMKILIYGTDYSDRNFDRVRRDGLILERLTQSPYVVDIYGFCGFNVLTPYAGEGTFSHEINLWSRGKRKLSPKTRLKYAVEVAAGLADAHDIDGEGLSSVAHGDLKGGQYLFMNGVIQLGDFNRGRFLRRNSTAPDTACTYTIGRNDAAFRSPEEYKYLPQTSAIDVWALGSILYEILTGKDVWSDTDTGKAQKLIKRGNLPTIEAKDLDSQDPVNVALREAIGMCYVVDPQKRAKAADVALYLKEKFSELPEE